MSGYRWRGKPGLSELNAAIMATRPATRPDIDREWSRARMRPLTPPPAPRCQLPDAELLDDLERAGLIRWLPVGGAA